MLVQSSHDTVVVLPLVSGAHVTLRTNPLLRLDARNGGNGQGCDEQDTRAATGSLRRYDQQGRGEEEGEKAC
jgi:hypothetical protein